MRQFDETEQIALSKMEFNPLRRSDEYIWDVYERLKIRTNLSATEEELTWENDEDMKKKLKALELKDWLIRFFILFIDPESPYAKIRDFEQRRDKCRQTIGELKGSIPKNVAREINKRGEVYSLIQSEFFKLVHDHDYVMWVSICASFEILTDRLRNPDATTDEMVKITKEINEVRKTLNELEKKLFNDSRILREIADEKQRQQITGYAERYAKTYS